MARNRKAEMRYLANRDGLWPNASEVVFDGVGWSQIPRTVPLIAGLINYLSAKVNAGSLYVALWAHDFGAGFVDVMDPINLIFEAGYIGSQSRAERTWRERIQVLLDLGFIDTKPKGRRNHGFILLFDPHQVVVNLHQEKPGDFPSGWFDYFALRCTESGVILPPPRRLGIEEGR